MPSAKMAAILSREMSWGWGGIGLKAYIYLPLYLMGVSGKGDLFVFGEILNNKTFIEEISAANYIKR